jgi:hypothetical protein
LKNYNKSISLLQPIPIDRNCDHLSISDEFCPCLTQWQSESVEADIIIDITEFVIEYINDKVNFFASFCSAIRLHKIVKAEISDKKNERRFKIEFQTMPNKATYKALIIENGGQYSIKSKSDIQLSGLTMINFFKLK